MSRRMLGLGGMGAGAIREGQKYGMEGVFVDIDPGKRQRIGENFNCPAYETVEEAFANHDDIVGAYIATPNETHADFAIKLADKDIPVFTEKPLGINKAECDAVIEAYNKSKGWIQVDFEYRFSVLYVEAINILHSGEMGELRSIHCEYSVGNYKPSQGWRLDPSRSGGLFAEKLCHMLDLIRIFTRSEPGETRISAAPASMDYYDPRSTDYINAQYVMENGVFANLIHTHGATAIPLRGDQNDVDWTEYGHRTTWYLNTTVGCIRVNIWDCSITLIRRDPENDYTPRIRREVSYRHIPFMEAHHDMGGMLRDFVRRVDAGEGPRLPMEDSYKTMMMVFESDRQLVEASKAANARFRDDVK